jgi:hypothetical protein
MEYIQLVLNKSFNKKTKTTLYQHSFVNIFVGNKWKDQQEKNILYFNLFFILFFLYFFRTVFNLRKSTKSGLIHSTTRRKNLSDDARKLSNELKRSVKK